MSACEKFRKYLESCARGVPGVAPTEVLQVFDNLHQSSQENTGQLCTSKNTRVSYEAVSIDEFIADLTNDSLSFATNMKKLSTDNMSFPEWYETFAAWLEVGTNEEEMMYHRADLCWNSGCKICFK
jgi:hypothetical protein